MLEHRRGAKIAELFLVTSVTTRECQINRSATFIRRVFPHLPFGLIKFT